MRRRLLLFALMLLFVSACIPAVAPVPNAEIAEPVTLAPTATPSHTPVPTLTLTSTPLPSHTPTVTSTATLTPIPTCTYELVKPAFAYLSNGIQVSVVAPFEMTPYVQNGELALPGLQVLINGIALESPRVFFVANNPKRVYVLVDNGVAGQVVEIQFLASDGSGLYCSGQIEIPRPAIETPKPSRDGSGNGQPELPPPPPPQPTTEPGT